MTTAPRSPQQVRRGRLNRGGDRQLNGALHDIVLTRWRICPRTQAYIAKRRGEGKTDNEIRRLLKRCSAAPLLGYFSCAARQSRRLD